MGLKIHSTLTLAILIACNKPSDAKKDQSVTEQSPEAENEDQWDETTQVGEIQIATGTMTDLTLSAALGFDVPSQVLAQGNGVQVNESGQVAISTALTELERKKSSAACQVRRRTKAGFRVLRGIARDLCYIENDAAKISIDKKYKIDFGNGDSKSIWIDHGDKSKLTVSFCANDKLTYVFTLSGNKDGKSFGTFKSVETVENSEMFVEGSYDHAYSEEGVVKINLIAKSVYPADGNAHVEGLRLRLDAENPSFVSANEWDRYKHESSGEFTTVFTSMYSIIGKNLGSGLIYLGGDQDGDGQPDSVPTAYRSFFDSAGKVLLRTASPLFADGSKVLTAVKNLRKPAGESFLESPFEDSAWDCSEAETITPLGSNDQYGVCDSLTVGFDDEDCSLAEFSDEGDEDITELAEFGL